MSNRRHQNVMRGVLLAFCLGLGLCAGLPGAALACNELQPCPVKGGSYLVQTPASWDGKSKLPVIVFFHGAFSTARDTMYSLDITGSAANAGALLVAADGASKNWAFPGKRNDTQRDDFAYAAAVLDDVEQRFPIDKSKILATGFSVGGSMVWYLACVMGGRFTAFAPVAGAYWEPLPDDCPSGPVALRHIHGLADKTVPMKGRSLRNGQFKQGDVLESFRRLRVRNGCPEEPDREEVMGMMTCRTWAAKSCASRKEAVLCLHPEDHYVNGQWVEDGFRWMTGLAKARAEK